VARKNTRHILSANVTGQAIGTITIRCMAPLPTTDGISPRQAGAALEIRC